MTLSSAVPLTQIWDTVYRSRPLLETRQPTPDHTYTPPAQHTNVTCLYSNIVTLMWFFAHDSSRRTRCRKSKAHPTHHKIREPKYTNELSPIQTLEYMDTYMNENGYQSITGWRGLTRPSRRTYDSTTCACLALWVPAISG